MGVLRIACFCSRWTAPGQRPRGQTAITFVCWVVKLYSKDARLSIAAHCQRQPAALFRCHSSSSLCCTRHPTQTQGGGVPSSAYRLWDILTRRHILTYWITIYSVKSGQGQKENAAHGSPTLCGWCRHIWGALMLVPASGGYFISLRTVSQANERSFSPTGPPAPVLIYPTFPGSEDCVSSLALYCAALHGPTSILY